MKVSVIFPTCYRPQMLTNMLDSLDRTTEGFDIETVAVVDCDLETLAIVEERCNVVDFANEMRGAAFCWNVALSLSSGDIIVPAGDDQLFHPHWLQFALESHQEKLGGFGVVGMNDLAYDGNLQLATMFLFDREYCKRVMGGIFAPPQLKYYCIDSWWNAKAKMLNCFYWEPMSVVEHLHSAHNKREIDRHDLFRMDEDWMAMDNKTFTDSLSVGLPITWESVLYD